MTPPEFSRIAGRLMRCPAAPFHEAGVRAAVELICAEHGLEFRRDRFGNVLVELKTARRARPLVLAAHMDHPGFEIVRELAPGRWIARFNGGVPSRYFRQGVPVRLLPGSTPAKILRRIGDGTPKELELVATRPAQLHGPRPHPLNVAATEKSRAGSTSDDEIDGDAQSQASHDLTVAAALEPDSRPAFAVWELEDFAVRGGLIHGRSCDDLVGVASVLATLIELKRLGRKVHVIGVISRAEEVGFMGALTVAGAGLLPRGGLVISLETSKELPSVEMGSGVIIRVGDRSSIFDSKATRFLTEVAADLEREDRRFVFQRALMSGGTCEATAYQEFGLTTAGVCIALGNYHNCGPRGRIASEFVSLADACGMVRLLARAAETVTRFDALVGRLPARLKRLLVQARQRLANGP
jgi:endoglucanase